MGIPKTVEEGGILLRELNNVSYNCRVRSVASCWWNDMDASQSNLNSLLDDHDDSEIEDKIQSQKSKCQQTSNSCSLERSLVKRVVLPCRNEARPNR